MSRFAPFALAFALFAVSAPAFAAPGRAEVAREEGAEKKFPMPAAEFRQHMATHQEKGRARMEEHIAKQKLSEEKASEVRGRFNAGVARINIKVEEVCADGTVTKEEAHEVRELAKSLFQHHHEGQKAKGRPAR